MPGRQAHGRPLLAQPKAKNAGNKKSKARSQKNALNAFGIAQENFSTREKRTPRFRELDADIERKHGREGDEEEEEEEEDEGPQRKKVKRPTRPANDNVDYGSDSEGNEWQLGGMAEDDEDSEIESDNAFGDSDDEKFNGYSFRGSKSQKKVGPSSPIILYYVSNDSRQDDSDEDSDDSNDEEGETLGEEAIDLATALDQWEEESEEEVNDKKGSGSDDSDSDMSDQSDEGSEDDESNDDDDNGSGDEADPEQLDALKGLVSGFGGVDEEEGKTKTTSKQKLSLADLGLSGIQDPTMKKSVKLLAKEDKEKRQGKSAKLDAPLSRREQGRLDRSVAYEKTNETLNRWTETVKQNRRADHLMFPLAQNSNTQGLNMTEMIPMSSKKGGSNELESAIFGIMEQSGLSMDKPEKPKEPVYDDEGNEMTKKQILAKKRMEREQQSREAKRAARIKKIKSKAYHRVHRKEKDRQAADEREEMDSEEEREAQDRRRALERVGQRHKESKWAKLGNKTKRGVWDEDFRAGLTEMARKDEELRRRKEGKGAAGGNDDSSSEDDSEDDEAAIRKKLDELEAEDDQPKSKLMQMKFMQKAEAARKKANDDMIRDIRRELDGEASPDSDNEQGAGETGRQTYGADKKNPFTMAIDTSGRAPKTVRTGDDDGEVEIKLSKGPSAGIPAPKRYGDASSTLIDESSTGNAWSSAAPRRKTKGSSTAENIDANATMVATRPKPKPKSRRAAQNADDDTSSSGSDSDSDAQSHMPLRIHDTELVDRAFGGEDVVGEFEMEKAEVEEADDDKVIDNTLPGWGSWVGDGVSKREQARNKSRFLTKVEGVKKKDRKDAKLERVIINEKRNKKVCEPDAVEVPKGHPY